MKLGGYETDPLKRAVRVYKEASVAHMFANTPEGAEPDSQVIDNSIVAGVRAALPVMQQAPIPMVLHCPQCHAQHVDAPAPGWDNPPHRSHLCHACGCVWRPADVYTTGVAAVSTRGQRDTWLGQMPRPISDSEWEEFDR